MVPQGARVKNGDLLSLPQTSTGTSSMTWWKAALTTKEASEFAAAIRSGGYPRNVGSDRPRHLPLPSELPRVAQFAGRAEPSVLIATGVGYSLDATVQRAKEKREPLLTPHGFFRELTHGDAGSALRFLREFGPLHWTQGNLSVADWTHLDDFWARQARFVAVYTLWHALRDGDEAIAQGWEWIGKNYTATKIPGEPDLGRKPQESPLPAELAGMTPAAVPMPWSNVPDQALQLVSMFAYVENRLWDGMARIDSHSSGHQLNRALAIALIQHEITWHTRDVQTVWQIEDDGRHVRYSPERHAKSLWAAMWELLAAETRSGYCWRYCKECGNPFYPVQINSECCSPEEQSLWSKRQWARKKRASAKESSHDSHE
jgi:hypothetical protein